MRILYFCKEIDIFGSIKDHKYSVKIQEYLIFDGILELQDDSENRFFPSKT
jgi:hypothetical protein